MKSNRLFAPAAFVTATVAALTIACSSDNDGAPQPPPSCGAHQTMCGALCADLMTDQANCGECGLACGEGQVCVDGICSGVCAGGYLACDGKCTNVKYDVDHCGECGNKCDDDEVCDNGKCATSCSNGTTLCERRGSFSCVDTLHDRANCGGCGKACEADQVCDNGTCTTSCGDGLTACNGTCVDTKNDPAYCGGCVGSACPSRPNAVAVCANGTCGAVCNDGFADCDGDPTNGCEDTLDSIDHCGSCGKKCTPPNNGTAICSSGDCVYDCDTGFELSGEECRFKVAFPSSTSTQSCGEVSGPLGTGGELACMYEGDSVEEAFDYPGTGGVTKLAVSFELGDATTGCATGEILEWNVLVNGVTVGSFAITGGSGVSPRTIIKSFTFAPIAPVAGKITLRFQAATTVCPDGGSWSWRPVGSASLY